MTTAQILLTETDANTLDAIASKTGKSRDQLLREAVNQFLLRFRPADRFQSLRQARGMWKDRDDLPDVRSLRDEMDRR
jgi:predicted transcriptional regulator